METVNRKRPIGKVSNFKLRGKFPPKAAIELMKKLIPLKLVEMISLKLDSPSYN